MSDPLYHSHHGAYHDPHEIGTVLNTETIVKKLPVSFESCTMANQLISTDAAVVLHTPL